MGGADHIVHPPTTLESVPVEGEMVHGQKWDIRKVTEVDAVTARVSFELYASTLLSVKV